MPFLFADKSRKIRGIVADAAIGAQELCCIARRVERMS